MNALVASLALLILATATGDTSDATLQQRKQVGRAFAEGTFVLATAGMTLALTRLREKAREAEHADEIERAYREIEAELAPRPTDRRTTTDEDP